MTILRTIKESGTFQDILRNPEVQIVIKEVKFDTLMKETNLSHESPSQIIQVKNENKNTESTVRLDLHMKMYQ